MKSVGMITVLLLSVCAVSQAQIQWGEGIQTSMKPNSYVREYTAQGKTVRSFLADLKSGTASGDTVTAVSGTASIEIEGGKLIATGQLQVVSGWIAVKGVQGARFKLFAGFDTRPTPSTRLKEKSSTPPAVVTLTANDEWKLDDDRFMFLIDSSYGLNPDFSSSFARNTRMVLPPNKTIELWGNQVSIGEKGGEIIVRNGNIETMKDAKVKKPKK
jgi:hypothetical protein